VKALISRSLDGYNPPATRSFFPSSSSSFFFFFFVIFAFALLLFCFTSEGCRLSFTPLSLIGADPLTVTRSREPRGPFAPFNRDFYLCGSSSSSSSPHLLIPPALKHPTTAEEPLNRQTCPAGPLWDHAHVHDCVPVSALPAYAFNCHSACDLTWRTEAASAFTMEPCALSLARSTL
jgi:hypothetical protein